MPKLVGINGFEGIDVDLSSDYFREPEGYTIERLNSSLEGITTYLAPVYSSFRRKLRKLSLEEIQNVLLGIRDVELKGNRDESQSHIEELAKKYGINPTIIGFAANASRMLGEEDYIRFVKNTGRIHRFDSELVLPYTGDFIFVFEEHARIQTTPGDYVLVHDLGSSYGTSVDGVLVGVNRPLERITDDEKKTFSRDELRGSRFAYDGNIIALAPLVLGEQYAFRLVEKK